MEKIAEEVMLHCMGEFEVESGSVFLMKPQEAALRLVSAAGPRANHHCGDSVAIGNGITGLVAKKRQPLILNDMLARSCLTPRQEEGMVKQFLSFPIVKEATVFAVVNVTGPKGGRKFGNREIERCKAISTHYGDRFERAFKRGKSELLRSSLYAIEGRKKVKEKEQDPMCRLLSCFPGCVLLFDASFRITFCNKEEELHSLFGNAGRLVNVGFDLRKLPLEISPDLLSRKLTDLRDRKLPFSLINVRAVGSRRVLKVKFSALDALRGGSGETGLAVLSDNTSNYEVQQKLIESERLSLIGSLTSIIVHEVNNPLDGVFRLVKMARSNVSEGIPADEYLDQALKGLQRMSALMKSFLGLSAKHEEPSSLNSVIKNVLALVRCRNSEKNIKVDLKLSPRNPLVDANHFHQIFVNLLANAVDAISSDNGIITIKTSVRSHQLRISIADNGCGIPEAQQARIFDAFWTTKEYGRGTGLGLTIVKKAVERHGGTIRAESREDAGTTFYLTFPESQLVT
ncbi:MAG: GHKL domain-containing protein [Candidatus Abyssobacteria bacterium SURF_5]|uniref:histidine kinase n=1 Tax=Abyssobacteria bacterium (strain SURF_5) TaxID=2093360 RepID=A0A3A4NUB9_ABYX5|nr:MAG: GHKL domain-containing protein [Candidatus Abyssubacteria bacterium SURF_5]